MAGDGAKPIILGSSAADADATMRARGVRLCVLTPASEAINTAAAPSFKGGGIAGGYASIRSYNRLQSSQHLDRSVRTR